MKRKFDRQGGFTLTEVIVATAIFAIIFVAALLIYDRSNQIFRQSVESGDTQQTTRAAFDRLTADLRMMGFDFDRDGVPTTGNREQQQDEQLEYIGPHAVTVRGNFDHTIDQANEFGREEDYEPVGGEFPVVTTANDEIVTYVLRSDDGPNNDSITFYADTRKPRATYDGGSDEQLVTIPGVNLCTNGCVDPPYTLYRVTLVDEDLTAPSTADKFNFTPVANNIRSLEFQYFDDATAAPATEVTPNAGVGQWTVSATPTAAALAARTVRANVQAIRVRIVGMTDAPVSGDFEDPVEMSLGADALDSAKRFRQYPLEAIIQPRNVGIRGMEEFDTTAPGAPTLDDVCVGSCGVVTVQWSPPAAGTVDSYTVLYDTSALGNCGTCSFGNSPVSVGNQHFAHVTGLDPTKTWYFKVIAVNSFGSSIPSAESAGVQPINYTDPEPPALLSASGGPQASDPPAQENDITIQWQISSANANSVTDSCGTDLSNAPSYAEASGFAVYRSDTSEVDGGTFTKIWEGQSGAAGAPTVDYGSGLASFVDKKEKLSCVPYYYKVQTIERCAAAAGLNSTNDTDLARSELSGEIQGQAVPAYAPEAPTGLTIATSVCDATIDTCKLQLQWSEVVQDVGDPSATPDPILPDPILVSHYVVEQIAPDGTTSSFDVVDNVIGDGTVTAPTTITPVPVPSQIYEYRVRAVRCAGGAEEISGALSDEVKYPCSEMTITTLGTGVLDGSGTANDPYVVGQSSFTLDVNTTAEIQSLKASLDGIYDLGSNITITGPQSAWIGVPVPNDGAPHQVIVNYVDINGCGIQRSVWLMYSPSNCCIAPFKLSGGGDFDSTVVTKLNDTQLQVRLVNLCGDDLTLKSIKLGFTQANPGNPKLQSIQFPESGGVGTVTYNFGGTPQNTPQTLLMTTVPSAKTIVNGGSSSYTMVLTFTDFKQNQTLTTAFAENVCLTYDRNAVAETNITCKIAQQADGTNCP